ncbi:hypothetical protein AB3U99_22360 [Niallia sp. JL1B1071]|uniref:hypothetical protein n=1 Tax=Niallia tiangongensis TaxID=3237105 RepID=UPI0037DD5183
MGGAIPGRCRLLFFTNEALLENVFGGDAFEGLFSLLLSAFIPLMYATFCFVALLFGFHPLHERHFLLFGFKSRL